MREIKFRAWVGNRFVYSGGEKEWLTMGQFGDWEYTVENNSGNGWCVENIQQFTGLLDGHNKQVYEGDILQIDWLSPTVVVVEWKAQGWSPFIEQGNTDWEIIGNIYENPELLQLKEI